MRQRRGRASLAVALLALTVGTWSAAPVGADPVDEASASSYVLAADTPLIDVPPMPTAEATFPPGQDVSNTTLPVDAPPLAINGTLTAEATAHQASDIDSALEADVQDVDGPYNATGVATVEGLDVLLDLVAADVSVLEADAVRAEAAAVCSAGVAEYTANSEVVNLSIAGNQVPLNGPLEDLIDQIAAALAPLSALIAIQANVVTELPDGGISVDALIITALGAPGAGPLVTVTIGHAEVGPLTCAEDLNECEDGIDNDGDGQIDFPNDPDCDSPDDSETPECSDEVDNDGDGVIDFPADPGCENPEDDDETNECSDGVDNDGDGQIDFPNDPDCDGPEDFEDPECNDGRDNDGDGRIDFPADPGCSSASDDDERDVLADTGSESGLLLGGGAIGLLAALLLLGARRRLTPVS